MTVFNCSLDELRQRTSIKWTRFAPDVLPMFVAEMDCRVPAPVAEAISSAVARGDLGYPERPTYQLAYADFALWRWGWAPDVGLIERTGDVMQGMRYTMEAVSRPGDKVVFNPPIYPPFRQIVEHTGRVGVEVPLVAGRLDLAGLERAFASGASVYLLCSPHNPTGTVHTRDELLAVADLARQYSVVVIVDEIHSLLNGDEFTPYLALPDPGVSFVSVSAAKAFNLAGIKAGLLVASPQGEPVLRRLPSYVAEAMSHLGAIAHTAALRHCRDWLVQMAGEIVENKRLFARLIAEQLPQLSYTPSAGTYLAWLDCTPLGLRHPGMFFHDEARVRFNFGAEFAADTQQWVRVNLATSREIIEEALRRVSATVVHASAYPSL